MRRRPSGREFSLICDGDILQRPALSLELERFRSIGCNPSASRSRFASLSSLWKDPGIGLIKGLARRNDTWLLLLLFDWAMIESNREVISFGFS